ncbi:MAG TPA: hypothetical protein VGB96_05430, partial [Archangium sp.]
SIQPPAVGPRLHPFRSCAGRILRGEPVGHATRDFRDRFSMASSLLLEKRDTPWASQERVSLWFERNDARNYVVLGDPAVRVRVERFA